MIDLVHNGRIALVRIEIPCRRDRRKNRPTRKRPNQLLIEIWKAQLFSRAFHPDHPLGGEHVSHRDAQVLGYFPEISDIGKVQPFDR
jgi:hypothetical protein